jgi:transposase
MELTHRVCCGIDVHNESLTACLRTAVDNETVDYQVRAVSTMLEDLEDFAAWLIECDCPIIAIESTGVYWRPVYHVLSRAGIEVLLANPHHVKQRKGKKTDRKDARWIAELLAHDLISPSFIPSPEITRLRDLTRLRTTLVNERTQHKNRVDKVLQDTNIKLSTVVSHLFGVSGRLMLDQLVSGNSDPEQLAQLAKGVLRKKIPAIKKSLNGIFTQHHALLIQMSLQNIDLLTEQILHLDAEIADAVAPFQQAIDRLETIPGISTTSARIIVSEIGTDMTRFGSPDRLASWAGMCPGNNVSAGKRRSGRTRKGNRHIRRILTEAAWTTSQTSSGLGHKFARLRDRMGGKKAAVAVGHTILVIVYHLLAEGTTYDEGRYGDLSRKQEERLVRRSLKTLARLGYTVTAEKQAA